MIEKIAGGVLGLIVLAIAILGAATTPLHYEDGFKNVSSSKASVISRGDESYGTDPLQVVTIRRDREKTTPTKTVIFIHGGGWSSGGRGSLNEEAIEWAKNGWITINVSYRVGVVGGEPDDGKLILADIQTVLDKYRAKSYVDPNKIIVYGESAGGHLSEWLGSKSGTKVAGFVAISPVSSISRAITAGQVEGAPVNVKNLGSKASEIFGYSVGTTDSHRYYDRVKAALFIYSTDEWVDPNLHAKVSCAALGTRCTSHEYPGNLHAGGLVDAHKSEIWIETRHWADAVLNSPCPPGVQMCAFKK